MKNNTKLSSVFFVLLENFGKEIGESPNNEGGVLANVYICEVPKS